MLKVCVSYTNNHKIYVQYTHILLQYMYNIYNFNYILVQFAHILTHKLVVLHKDNTIYSYTKQKIT